MTNLNNARFALDVAEAFANTYFDGHFTLMKFTTDWRCRFGPPPLVIDKKYISEMAEGLTAYDAINRAMQVSKMERE